MLVNGNYHIYIPKKTKPKNKKESTMSIPKIYERSNKDL